VFEENPKSEISQWFLEKTRCTSSTPFACKLNALLAANVNASEAKYSSSKTSSNGGMSSVSKFSQSVTISPLPCNHDLLFWTLTCYVASVLTSETFNILIPRGRGFGFTLRNMPGGCGLGLGFGRL
jgi:hypothetical protein